MIERKNKRTAKIGVFAVAHGVYWEQFEGLLDNIMKSVYSSKCNCNSFAFRTYFFERLLYARIITRGTSFTGAYAP